MKRFHVHLRVQDLQASVAFYSRLFQTEPARLETDYAKWMLDDPRLNFAISTRGGAPGLDHLGMQVESSEELASLRAAAQQAELAYSDEGQTSCCYARSEKHWITDPQGLAWEQYHTMADIAVFHESTAAAPQACCAPARTPEAASCCASAPSMATSTAQKSACCG